LFGFADTKERIAEYVDLFGCKEGELPFRFLGISMNHCNLSNKDWSIVEERFQKRLSSWKGKVLSSGGRLVLINSVLSSLSMFMMSFFRIPKGVWKSLTIIGPDSFGNVMSTRRNIDWLDGVSCTNRRVSGV
jgi:hypothetical protein